MCPLGTCCIVFFITGLLYKQEKAIRNAEQLEGAAAAQDDVRDEEIDNESGDEQDDDILPLINYT